jgi:hypothetical protein
VLSCAAVAIAAVTLAVAAAEPPWEVLVVTGLAMTLVLGSLTILRDARRGRVGILGGELVVDAAFAYTVVVLASRPGAAPLRGAEFLVGLAGIIAGTVGLNLARLPVDGRAWRVRQAVTMITGTILAAVAVGQLEHPGLVMRWNWIPFLAFAVPGMLAHLAATMTAPVSSARWSRIPRSSVGTAGLALLLYGSVNNLGLGAGGWGAGVGLDAGTTAAWAAAFGLLVLCSSASEARPSARYMLFLAGGVPGMAITERAEILRTGVGFGPAPASVSHGAPLLVAALGVLVAIPLLRPRSDVRGAEGRGAAPQPQSVTNPAAASRSSRNAHHASAVRRAAVATVAGSPPAATTASSVQLAWSPSTSACVSQNVIASSVTR